MWDKVEEKLQNKKRNGNKKDKIEKNNLTKGLHLIEKKESKKENKSNKLAKKEQSLKNKENKKVENKINKKNKRKKKERKELLKSNSNSLNPDWEEVEWPP